MTPLVYSLQEAAAALGVSEWSVRRFVADGLLPAVRYPSTRDTGRGNRRVLISVDALRAFRDQHQEGGTR